MKLTECIEGFSRLILGKKLVVTMLIYPFSVGLLYFWILNARLGSKENRLRCSLSFEGTLLSVVLLIVVVGYTLLRFYPVIRFIVPPLCLMMSLVGPALLISRFLELMAFSSFFELVYFSSYSSLSVSSKINFEAL